MADIQIETETEGENNWAFEVTVTEDGRAHHYQVTLAWADYDLWCRGRLPPQRVVRAAFKFLLSKEPASSILSRFDCSVIRRYFADVDQELPKML